MRRLRDVYRSIDEVDTMVGLFAETPPDGFGFSDTAFRIFILMASRRLQSDRFLTVDFRPEIYSPLGIDWIENNGMTSVILRHCPDLAGDAAARRERLRAVAAGRPPARDRGRGDEHDDGPCGTRSRRAARAAAAADASGERRTHRVSRGSSVSAGSMSYESTEPREPLTELEEAVLIALTGCTGLTMPDRPFNDPRNGKPIMAKPNLNMGGRTAGSPDNAQGTHFFLINDTGTYFLRKLPPPEGEAARCSTRTRCSRAPRRPR